MKTNTHPGIPQACLTPELILYRLIPSVFLASTLLSGGCATSSLQNYGPVTEGPRSESVRILRQGREVIPARGMALQQGDRIITLDHSAAVVTLQNANVTLFPSSALEIGAESINLRRGKAAIRAPKGFAIVAGHTTGQVAGTYFFVESAPPTKWTLIRGHLSLEVRGDLTSDLQQTDSNSMKLTAGQQAVLPKEGSPKVQQAAPEEIQSLKQQANRISQRLARYRPEPRPITTDPYVAPVPSTRHQHGPR